MAGSKTGEMEILGTEKEINRDEPFLYNEKQEWKSLEIHFWAT
jgi:hypothetical protein